MKKVLRKKEIVKINNYKRKEEEIKKKKFRNKTETIAVLPLQPLH